MTAIGFATIFMVAVPWCKLCGGEGNAGKHFARVFGATGCIATFLGGDAVVNYGNNKLRISFQTNDRELSQSYKQTSVATVENKLVIKHMGNCFGNLNYCVFSATAFADILHFRTEDHWIKNFHNGSWAVSNKPAGCVGAVDRTGRSKDVRLTVFTAQNCPLGEHC